MADACNILVVDDEPSVCGLMCRWLEREGYQSRMATSGGEALELLADSKYCLMITDINMPEITGIELLSTVKKKYQDLAVIMATAVDDRQVATHALNLGAFGYVIKPLERNELLISTTNALRRRDLEIQNRLFAQEMEQLVQERTKALRKKEAEVKHSREETIQCLARAAEFRDDDTARHTVRMGHYCKILAEKAGLPVDYCELIGVASPLHDVGKIGIPDSILLKPGKLTTEEFGIIKEHAIMGYRILADSNSEMLRMAAIIARTHHEKYDGTGYPNGLIGESIPIAGRIAAICDVFDALTFDRVYKKAFTVEQAIEFLQENRGKHFDPELVDLFLGAMDEVLMIKGKFCD